MWKKKFLNIWTTKQSFGLIIFIIAKIILIILMITQIIKNFNNYSGNNNREKEGNLFNFIINQLKRIILREIIIVIIMITYWE